MSSQISIPTFDNVESNPVNYLDFWPGYADLHEIADPGDVKKTRELASYLGRLTTHVIHGGDPLRVALMPHVITKEPQALTISNAVAEWDRTLGTLNPLAECQPDLLRAAGLLMQANFLGRQEDFNASDVGGIYAKEQFVNVALRNPWESQGPTEDLLLIAQLIHKAALLEPDERAKEELLETAVGAYNRLYKDPTAEWQDRLLAGQYQADIYFYWLGQEMRRARDAGDRHHFGELQETAMELLQEQIVDLRQVGRLLDLPDNPTEVDVETDDQHVDEGSDTTGWAGFMLEGFANLAVRDLVYVCSNIDRASTRGVRRAFRHEDQPRNLRLKPKQSFDMVVQGHDNSGRVVSTWPVQLKLLSRRTSKSPDHRFNNEYGNIPVVAVKRCSPSKILSALDELSIAHAERQLERSRGPLSRVQNLLRFAVRGEVDLVSTH